MKKDGEEKLKHEISLKNERIKVLEKYEKRFMAEKEKAEAVARQLGEAQEMIKGAKADRDLGVQERKLMEDKLKRLEGKVADFEYETKRGK